MFHATPVEIRKQAMPLITPTRKVCPASKYISAILTDVYIGHLVFDPAIFHNRWSICTRYRCRTQLEPKDASYVLLKNASLQASLTHSLYQPFHRYRPSHRCTSHSHLSYAGTQASLNRATKWSLSTLQYSLIHFAVTSSTYVSFTTEMVFVKARPAQRLEPKFRDPVGNFAHKKDLAAHVWVIEDPPCFGVVDAHSDRSQGISQRNCLERSSKWECAWP